MPLKLAVKHRNCKHYEATWKRASLTLPTSFHAGTTLGPNLSFPDIDQGGRTQKDYVAGCLPSVRTNTAAPEEYR
jgi:hypothetical protein